jgi:uncharacterized damage-inducible protein DinB
MNLIDIDFLFKYNFWARHRISDVVKTVPGEDYRRNLGSSHGGIHGTLVHMMSAEEIWLKRWKGEPTAGLHDPEEFSGFSELEKAWDILESSITGFLGTLHTDQDIYREIKYSDLRGNQYHQPLYQLMQHLVNHSSYHRGQIVALLRQVNIKPVGTDLVTYIRTINRPST